MLFKVQSEWKDVKLQGASVVCEEGSAEQQMKGPNRQEIPACPVLSIHMSAGHWMTVLLCPVQCQKCSSMIDKFIERGMETSC
ncbi:hypothetical protein F2P79_008605 [Pimephales promelas]|nr:hypothetical protein F2P79_008605 [Pimephales promelas]